uniref:Uncharacterized protein n=1 Tax=Grammatophora oceanica TaxID=210454 RepID=A0A7S1UYQ3_9STRA|mmetsp:Transcript_27133/g.39735  ORF Transcript_27133/g.39735 Transcript_27133/m.39735 type:complete len:302 (+) Transcript_27133:165-1070(+)|eukprot:CAMPEP_0194064086 /NCGR_PEP_ID=MMETSP0009_2-20130614/82108_1 /TAXON_ID=210454 /ORGANISM="Grammatophora oceanica, Strain CCMP 410" /LENGTH=301 /DNA_ID=CAMNT_0038716455 /DNA_START=121 /DNA_END=1026 /DNA_ORIENTATION=+
MSHWEQQLFISCEDALPTIVPGLHNAACSATSILLMTLPYRALLVAKNKTGMEPEVIAYLLALTFLFYTNAHQHGFGAFLWDLDTGGALHSIFLSLLIYEHGGGREIWKNKTPFPILPTVWTRAVSFASAAAALMAPFVFPTRVNNDLRRKFAATMGGIAALSVVPMMGYLSWTTMMTNRRHEKNSNTGKSLFALWVLACVLVKVAEVLVQVEKERMCDRGGLVARWFHAIVTHSEIWLLFWAVSDCAFGLIQQQQDRSTHQISTSDDVGQSLSSTVDHRPWFSYHAGSIRGNRFWPKKRV